MKHIKYVLAVFSIIISFFIMQYKAFSQNANNNSDNAINWVNAINGEISLNNETSATNYTISLLKTDGFNNSNKTNIASCFEPEMTTYMSGTSMQVTVSATSICPNTSVNVTWTWNTGTDHPGTPEYSTNGATWYAMGAGPYATITNGVAKSITLSSATTFYGRVRSTTTPVGTLYSDSKTVSMLSPSTAPTSLGASPLVVQQNGTSTLTITGGSLGTGAVWKWYSGGCGVEGGGTLVQTGGTSYTTPPLTVTTTYYVRAEGTCNTTACVSQTIAVTSIPDCDFIYVSKAPNADDANSGGPANPVKTLAQAMTLVSGSRNYIKMAEGSYSENQRVNITTGLTIEGGFTVSGAEWTKSSDAITEIAFPENTNTVDQIVGGTRQLIGVVASGVSNWTLQDLKITTAAVTGVSSDNKGSSNYAVWINGCSNYNIIRCNITSGNASGGTNGSGYESNGGNGNGTGGSGGGGKSGNNATSNAGGAGGAGTSGTGGNPGATGGGGGTAGAVSSTCSAGSGCGTAGCNGPAGNTGGNGQAGKAWASDDRPSSSLTNSSYFVPNGQAESGGGGGGGGSGGGGSGSIAGRYACVNCSGNNGGNGGAGGSGGGGGKGGFGAGGSFAVWCYNSSTGANFSYVNTSIPVSVAFGGNGVSGQAAPNTGLNTGKTNGSCNSCWAGTRCSGDGGSGGSGGAGGRGRDGANGLNYGLVNSGVGSNPTTIIPATPVVTILHSTHKICKNSEIPITKASGTWTLPAGISFVDDLKSGTSSYTTASASASVYAASLSTVYNLTSPLSFSAFIRTSSDDRALPVITSSAPEICIGSTLVLSATHWDAGSIIDYEWLIYPDATTPNPASYTFKGTSAAYTTPAFTSTGTYIIRYRELHSCCGWSRPAYKTVIVKAPAITGLATNDFVWAGGTDLYWGTPSNWIKYNAATQLFNLLSSSDSPPGSGDNVYIRATTGCPASDEAHIAVGATASCKNITIESTLTMDNNSLLNVSGNWNNAGTFNPGAETVTFNGTGTQTITTGGTGAGKVFNNVTVNKSSGSATLAGAIDINGNFTLSAGTWDVGASNYAMSVGGNWTNSGTFTPQSGTVTFDGSGAQTINAGGTGTGKFFNNVTVNKSSGSATLAGAIDINGSFTLSAGSWDVSSNNYAMSVAGNWTNNATFTPQAGTVTFDGSGAQTINTGGTGAGKPFNNVLINKSAQTATLAADIYILGNFSILSGTWAAGSLNMYVLGNWVNSGIFSCGTGNVIFNGAVQQITSGNGSGNGKFYNVVFYNTSTTLNDAMTINGLGTFELGIVSGGSLTFGNGATTSCGLEQSFYNGTVTKTGTNVSEFKFPTGEGLKSAPIAIAPTATSTTYTATYHYANPGCNWDPWCSCDLSLLDHASSVEYWELTSTNEHPLVTLYWNNNDAVGSSIYHGITNTSDLIVAHKPGSCWQSKGGSVSSNSVASTIAFASYSPITFGTKKNTNPLPVNLLSFNAACVNNDVDISWSTATESNNDYFTVERSEDAQNWNRLLTVDGAGNSNNIRYYSAKDADPLNGTSYYRLKQTDFDGHSETFNPIAVSCGATESKPQISYYPNPFTSDVIVDIHNLNTDNATLVIYDVLGKKVYEKTITVNELSESKFSINLGDLPEGVFMVNFTSAVFSNTSRIVKSY